MNETDKDYVITAELPGLGESDVQVEIDENRVLTIRGEKKAETQGSKGGVAYTERSYGEFVRSVQLPTTVDPDKAQATFKNGVLELHVPKTEQAKPRAVPIGKGGESPQAKQMPAGSPQGGEASKAQPEKAPSEKATTQRP